MALIYQSILLEVTKIFIIHKTILLIDVKKNIFCSGISLKEGEKKWFQVEWQTDSRVGSRKNIQHKAGGGDIKVFIIVMM